MSGNQIDPVIMEPREFSRLVKRTPVDELRAVMHGDRRGHVLDELVRRMPGVFRPDRAGAMNAVIHWNIGDRPDGGTDVYELVIADGVCQLSDQPDREPKLTLSLGAVDFLHLVTGNARAVMLVMKGKLKTKGDMALTAKFPSLFDVPKP
ncbi:SCP2 sterol-binding domain-containing protein [Solwaraspora sp. WMMD406]|uniref:SCP2 sterol-binding domain-containing protein n=1 Tax=Solwaraspora sp. WMMD406 TaxID=3016095 RepID=UPI0024164152|nr:SCP2 sterol-binding domain-containing protein [Solwaraspora sp. WMMD406]MDG4766935.1 SCP2 sterol-binding domain-containing protein [Solwaraspora sp. WMMD406]